MRFMMIMKPNIDEQNWAPDPDTIAEMGKFNDALSKAGVLLALDAGSLRLDGSRRELDDFLGLFAQPVPAGA